MAMSEKPTYEELEKRALGLEKAELKRKRPDENFGFHRGGEGHKKDPQTHGTLGSESHTAIQSECTVNGSTIPYGVQ
jgi:hypothetical protein